MKPQKPKGKPPWSSRDEYEDVVFQKAIDLYCKTFGEKLQKELDSRKSNDDVDINIIKRLLDEAK